LIVVTNDKETGPIAGIVHQDFEDFVLQWIRILIFINQQMAKSAPVFFSDIIVIVKQPVAFKQKVIKIE